MLSLGLSSYDALAAPLYPTRCAHQSRSAPLVLSEAKDDGDEFYTEAEDDIDLLSRRLRFYDDDEEDMPDDFSITDQSWIDYNFVADYGWDPLKLSRFDLNIGSAGNKERPLPFVIRDYREAELRHGRLAMLAALAWPTQELLSPALSRAIRAPMLMAETGGRSPSVLNGGLEQSTIPITLAAFAALIAAVDLYSLKLRADRGDDWLPGDFGFDPLNIIGGSTLEARREMQAAEINNGRLAMVAVVTMVVEEYVTKQPVVQLTPWLFEPFIFFPEIQRLLDAEFAVSAFRQN